MELQITRRSNFGGLREPWTELFLRSPRATVFQSYEWVAGFFEEGIDRKGELLLLTVQNQDQLVGVAPFMLRSVGRIQLLGGDYNDVLIAPEAEEEVLRTLSGWLGRLKGWYLADLRSLHPDAALRLLSRQPEPLRAQEADHQAYAVVELPDSHAAFLASLGKNLRQDLRYYPRRLAKDHGEPTLRKADAATWRTDMETLFHLHGLRWESKGEPGIFGSEPPRKLHLRVAEEALSRGDLALYTLEVESRAIASLYCLGKGAEMLYYLAGFDPEFGGYRPAKILLNRAIEEEYKARWGTTSRWTKRLLLSTGGVKSRLVVKALELQPKLKALRKRKS
jgi:CelD/BcsL family acetyltransferase involved in cellulose biosynthesis